MKVIKRKNEFGLIISFLESEKQFDISFGGNLDLYWTIHSKKESDHHDFTITKENYKVYRLFEELFDDIKNIKIFDEEHIPFYYTHTYPLCQVRKKPGCKIAEVDRLKSIINNNSRNFSFYRLAGRY